jgi:membrane protein DedA with SNARE-associated domain
MLPVTVVALFLALAFSTLISEDLACVAGGLLVSDGRAGFLLVTLACFTGIFAGDILLFLVGKFVGERALRMAPVRWLISPERLDNSSKWLERNGATVILTSRFIPGTRLPTYLAAGMLHKRSLRFVLYFFLSCAIWTPILVGSTAGFFTPLMRYGAMAGSWFWLKLAAAVVLFLLLLRVAIKSVTYRGRREMVGWFYRKVRWEFWPPWLFYPPVFLYVLYLGWKFKGLTTFTASNPGIEAGGFVGESKEGILKNLSGAGEFLLRSAMIAAGEPDERVGLANEFMAQNQLSWPVVLKPDAGQRGSGVAVIRSEAQLREYLARANYDILIQEYAAGQEFGVFYFRHPSEADGHIFSITEKRLPVLIGDGKQSLEHLILGDKRAVCMADFYFRKNAEQLDRVPVAGEAVQLVELGTHCRGAIFLDGRRAITPELTESIDRISKSFKGFYFGRYDLRTASIEDLMAGRNFKVIELNGVSSEATHIYDPKLSLIEAYRVLFRQWRIAFEIGNENRTLGATTTSVRALAKSMVAYREISRGHGD